MTKNFEDITDIQRERKAKNATLKYSNGNSTGLKKTTANVDHLMAVRKAE